MSRVTKAIDDELVALCELELKRQGIRGENGRRLQAIISAKKHGIKQVAQIYDISRETLMRWIRKFKAGGSKAFAVESGRGRPSKLQQSQLLKVQTYITKEGANLSSKKLANYVEEKFGIILSNATSHRLLKGLGFSYITPRPSHYKKDPKKQEEFKKKSRTRSKQK
jgi:transposase